MTASTQLADRSNLKDLYEAGDYGQALRLIDEALLPALEANPNDPALAGDALLVANVYRDLARFGAAESFYLQALAGLAAAGKDRPAYARALAELASLYERLDRDDQALELYASARSIHEAAGSDPAGHARCLHNLAGLLAGVGRRREAVACVRQARLLLRSATAEPTAFADLLLDEGHVLGGVEDVGAAARRAREALALRLRHSCDAHPETAYARLCLGRALAALGEFDEAAGLVEAARARTVEVLGESHPRHAAALGVLALLRSAQGEQRQAEALAHRALGVYQDVLGEGHCWTADGHRTLGAVLQADRKPLAAAEQFELALGILQARMGEDHPQCSELRLDLAECLQASGRHEDAVDLARTALAELDAYPDDVRYELAGACLALGRLKADAGEWDEADALAARAAALGGEVGEPLVTVPATLLRAQAEGACGDGAAASAHLATAEAHLARLPARHPLRDDADALRAALAWLTGDPESAVRLARERVRRAEQAGPRSPGLAPTLAFLAEQLHRAGDASEAEAAYERALDLQRRRGPDYPELAVTLRGLAQLHLERGNPRAAEVRFRQALEIRKGTLGDRHPATAESLADLAGIAYRAGDLPAAEAMFRDALAVLDECLGAAHPDAVAALHGLAWAVWGLGETAAAAELLERRLPRLREGHPLREPLRHTLALIRHARGNVAGAVALLTEVLAAHEKAAGDEPAAQEAAVPALADLARIHTGLGDHLEARGLLDRIRRIHAASPLARPLDPALDLVNLSDSHGRLHDLDRAGDLAEEALGQARAALPVGDPGLVDFLAHTAAACRERGRFRRAGRLLAEAEDAVRRAGGERHPRLAGLWVERGKLEQARGRTGRCGPLFERAAVLAREALGEDHPDHAAVRRLLAAHLQGLGRHAEAGPHLRANLEIVRRSGGNDHPALAAAHQALAELHRQAGDLEAAEAESRAALDLIRRSGQPLEAQLAGALHGLGVLCRLRGKLSEAAGLFGQALAIDGEAAGGEGSAHLETQRELAWVEAADGRPGSALERLTGILDAQVRLVPAYGCLPAGPERDALLAGPWGLTEEVLTLAAATGCASGAEAALRWHAVSPSQWAAGGREAALWHPADAERLHRLSDLNLQIAARVCGGAGREGARLHKELLARWTSERDQLEEDLAGRVPPLARLHAWRSADAGAVRAALPSGTLVEVIRYRPRDFRELCAGREGLLPARYVALVLHAAEAGSALVDVGPAEIVERGGEAMRAALAPALQGRGAVVVGTGGRLGRGAWCWLGEGVRLVRSGRELVSPLLAPPSEGWVTRALAWLGL